MRGFVGKGASACAVTIAVALFATSAAFAIEPNGSFIRTPSDFKIYRIAGGAPVHVHTCAPLNGCPGTKDVPNLNGYSTVPANGTHLRTANGPAEGLITTIAGGARFGVGDPSACNALPGCNSPVNIDAGGIAAYDKAHPVAADRTFLRLLDFSGGPCCAVLRVAGGHPLPVASCTHLDGCAGYVDIDKRGFDGYANSHQLISDGAFVRVVAGSRAGEAYRGAGGTLLRVTDCIPLGGCSAAVDIEARAIDGYVSAHSTPADGTVLAGTPSGQRWRIAGGQRFLLPLGSTGGVLLNDATILGLPSGDPLPAAPKARTRSFKIAVRKRRLVVEPVMKGSRVAIVCKRRCGRVPRGARLGGVRKAHARKGVASVRLRRRARIRLGTRFAVRVTAPGRVGRETTYAVRKLGGVPVAQPVRRRCFDGRLAVRC